MKKLLILLVSVLLMTTNKMAAIGVTPVANLHDVTVNFTGSETFAAAIEAALANEPAQVPTTGVNLVINVTSGTFTAADVATLKSKSDWQKVAGIDLSSATGLKVTEGMFNGWDYLSKIVLPDGALTPEIPNNAFRGCNNLVELTVGSNTNTFPGVTKIGDAAFAFAFSNTDNRAGAKVSLSFPDCTEVSDYAFQNTAAIATASLSDNTTKIGANAFQNSGIEYFPVSSSNTALGTIYHNAFQNCDYLVDVVIPEGVVEIQNDAFENCAELKTFKLGSSVASIAVSATSNCPKLIEFVVPASNNSFSAIDGFLLSKDRHDLIRCPSGLTGDRFLTNGFANVTTIKENAFQGSKLTKLTLSDNITTIERFAFPESQITEIVINNDLANVNEQAFDGAKKLTTFSGGQNAGANEYTTKDGILYKNGESPEIKTLARVPEGMTQEQLNTVLNNWPSTLTELGPSCFRDCDKITTVTLPDNITTFGTHTFANCTGLTTITLPANLITFGDAPFQFCENLSDVELGSNTNFTKEDGIIYGLNNNNEKTLYLFPAGLDNAKPKISPDTKVIAAEAFAYTNKVQEIKVPQGVHTLEAGCFHATSAQTIIIPHSVVNVANADVFSGCQQLTKIYWLPEKLLGYFINTNQGNQWSSNLFYQAKLENINVYVSNEYTDTNANLGTSSLVDLYSRAKGNIGADKGWGDCHSVQGVYHRALTEDYSATATLGNTGVNNVNKTNPAYANQTSENNYTFLTLYRDFSKPENEDDNAEPYYTLVLPVSLTATEVTETFGEGTEIYHFAGREEKTLNFSTATTVNAGEPFIIRPKNRATAYLLDLRSSTPAAVAVDNDTHKTGNGKVVENCPVEEGSYTYSFKATYQQDAEVPAYSYYVSNEVAEQDGNYYGVVKYLTKAGKFRKALRGYINCENEQPESIEPAKGITFMSFNGVATSIADIHFEGAPARQQNGVYTLSGQQVRTNGTSLEGLPKGIYVVNGKKTIVK